MGRRHFFQRRSSDGQHACDKSLTISNQVNANQSHTDLSPYTYPKPTRLLCPRDFPGKNTGECCHFLLRGSSWPKDQTFVSSLAGGFFTSEPPGKPTCQNCSASQSCVTVANPWTAACQASLSFNISQSCSNSLPLSRDAIQLSRPLSSPSPPTFNLSQHQGLFQWVCSSHQVAKVLSFSFNLSPSNEYSGLISFRMDWFDLLAVQGTLKNLLQPHSLKASII